MISGGVERIDQDEIVPHTRHLYLRAGLFSLSGNLLLLAGKGFVAWLTGSSAIYADAADSASDLAYSLLMMIGLWISLQPPDTQHPHGHQRVESLISLFIGLMMGMAGYRAANKGVSAWAMGSRRIVSAWPFVLLPLTFCVKGGMYYAMQRFARRSGSSALLASAKDNLTDMFSSATALVGVSLNQLGVTLADPAAAFLISLWIFFNAFGVLRTSVGELVGRAPSSDLYETVVETVQSVSGVSHVHRVILEYVGPRVRADIHINMDPRLTLDKVHGVSDMVTERVEALDEVEHAFVHVEPSDAE
ncbi:MAG: cation diffusion facilitator family transporter [Chloroflexota bacterium]